MARDVSDERQSLIESLPLQDDVALQWAQQIGDRLGKTDKCPPLAELIELSADAVAAPRAAELRKHVESCQHCRAWYAGLTKPWDAKVAAEEFRRLFRPGSHPTAESPQWSKVTRFVTKCSRGEQAEAVAELREHFPAFLTAVGLDPALADRFGKFLMTDALNVSRDRPPLPQWLRNFATQQLGFSDLPYEPTAEEWEAVLERSFLQKQLKRGLAKDETKETRWFRDTALARDVPSFDRLQQLALAPEFPTFVQDYCTRFCSEGKRQKNRLLRRLEMQPAA